MKFGGRETVNPSASPIQLDGFGVNPPPSSNRRDGMCDACLPLLFSLSDGALVGVLFFLDPYLNLFTFVSRTHLIRRICAGASRNRLDVLKSSEAKASELKSVQAEIGSSATLHVYLIVSGASRVDSQAPFILYV